MGGHLPQLTNAGDDEDEEEWPEDGDPDDVPEERREQRRDGLRRKDWRAGVRMEDGDKQRQICEFEEKRSGTGDAPVKPPRREQSPTSMRR